METEIDQTEQVSPPDYQAISFFPQESMRPRLIHLQEEAS